jgi:hypothetical protein
MLGTSAINLQSLKANPHVYAKVLWRLLRKMEDESEANHNMEMTIECDMA